MNSPVATHMRQEHRRGDLSASSVLEFSGRKHDETSTVSDERRWAPGGHCLIITWSGKQTGADVHASGICGWNPATKEIVETWHLSDGNWNEVRYPLAGMQDGIWKGTTSWTESDGRKLAGTCQLQQNKEDFVWTCEWTDKGQQQSIKLNTRKIHE